MMLAGELAAGGASLDGTIEGVEVRVENGGVVVSWEHVGVDGEETGHRIVVTLDGDVVAALPAGSTSYSFAGLDDGEHRVDVYLVREETIGLPDFHGTDYGRRAWLSWPASTSSDCRGYAIYTNGGTGTVDTDEAVAVVDEIGVHERWAAGPDSGTGTGRVTILGSWRGVDVNATYSVKIVEGQKFQHNLSGSWSTAQAFVEGGTYDLGNGALVRFESAASLYDVDDTWTFRVGPPVSWLSGELAEGTHQFQVAARDAAGNESSLLAAVDVVIIHRPGAVSGLAATWDGTEITLAWTLPDDEDLAAVRIYSNESLMFGTLADRVIESGPWSVEAADATGKTFTPSVDGVWRFLVRTVDTAGRESDSAEIVTVDTSDIGSAVALRVPEAVTVTPIAGGKVLVEWNYPTEDGGDLEHFNVYVGETDPPSFTSATDTVEASDEPGPIVAYSWKSDVLAGTRYIVVRASDGEVETQNTIAVEAVPDADAPSLSGTITGVAN